MTDISATSPLKVTIPPGNAQQGQFWSGDAPSFKDVLDIINPLQHIPVISNIYQSLTGDIQSPGAKLAGGTLYGGPIGFVASLFDSIFQSATGADVGSNLIAALEGKAVPALQQTADNSVPYLTASQRTGYNAYVQAGLLA